MQRRIVMAFLMLGVSLSLFPAQGAERLAKAKAEPNIAGVWKGSLDSGGKGVAVVLQIYRVEGEEEFEGDCALPDQKVKGILLSQAGVRKGNVRLALGAMQVVIEGKLSEDGELIAGKWNQGQDSLALSLKRTGPTPLLRRPQRPRKPYPYDEEDVVVENKKAGGKLAGTLTLPRGRGRVPAVLLLAGSGPADRDSKAMGHRPYLVLADHLTRQGFAVLRMDKRGIGKSTGEARGKTTGDLAADAALVLTFLRGHARVNAARVGLIGHSEGGFIAALLAGSSHDVAFIVLLGGPGLPGSEVMVTQAALVARAQGVDAKTAAWDSDLRRRMFAIIKEEKDNAAAKKKIGALFAEEMAKLAPADKKLRAPVIQGLASALDTFLSPWIRYFLAADPRPYLRKVRCPVLALTGSKDLQTRAGENLAEIAKALKAGGNRKYTTEELPGLNHFFQTCKNGSPEEYLHIEETFAPAALKQIAAWLRLQAGLGG